jgi:hypothetical protein
VRTLLCVTALSVAALTLAACQDKHAEPVPAPKTVRAIYVPPTLPVRAHLPCRRHVTVSEISWFQGTLDEAFAPAPGARLVASLLSARRLQSPPVGPVAQRLVQGTHQ